MTTPPIEAKIEFNKVRKAVKLLLIHIDPRVPIKPLINTNLLFLTFVILESPSPAVYIALSFVVHILSPSTIIAGIISP